MEVANKSKSFELIKNRPEKGWSDQARNKSRKNKLLREQIEKEPFVRAGYKVIFVWEDEV